MSVSQLKTCVVTEIADWRTDAGFFGTLFERANFSGNVVALSDRVPVSPGRIDVIQGDLLSTVADLFSRYDRIAFFRSDVRFSGPIDHVFCSKLGFVPQVGLGYLACIDDRFLSGDESSWRDYSSYLGLVRPFRRMSFAEEIARYVKYFPQCVERVEYRFDSSQNDDRWLRRYGFVDCPGFRYLSPDRVEAAGRNP